MFQSSEKIKTAAFAPSIAYKTSCVTYVSSIVHNPWNFIAWNPRIISQIKHIQQSFAGYQKLGADVTGSNNKPRTQAHKFSPFYTPNHEMNISPRTQDFQEGRSKD